jgi:hypothetical protein
MLTASRLAFARWANLLHCPNHNEAIYDPVVHRRLVHRSRAMSDYVRLGRPHLALFSLSMSNEDDLGLCIELGYCRWYRGQPTQPEDASETM